jgi:predicted dehydrogenase
MITIAIIGAGGIGTRHLQAVIQLDLQSRIYVVDTSANSLEKARAAYLEESHKNIYNIEFINSIDQIQDAIDIAIIATSSNVRANIIFELLNRINVRYLILEKFLFPRLRDYNEISLLLEKKKCKAWVNCARRVTPAYQKLQEYFSAESNIVFSMVGGNWGLGCNAIHFIDMLAYVLNDTGEFTFNTEYLDSEIIESKRNGYIEFTGTLTGRSDKCSFFSLHSGKNQYPGVISFSNQNIRCIIEEFSGKAFIATRESGWKQSQIEFPMLFVSQTTKIIVEELIARGDCSLPTYDESSKLHKALLSAFLAHYNFRNDSVSDICPIT